MTDLTTDHIRTLLDGALMRAAALGARIIVAVVDVAGETCGLVRMAGADTGASSIAVDKAWTSVNFGGQSTGAMSDFIAGFPPHAIALLASRPRYLPLAGALPLRIAGRLVGAVGIAGATPDQDEDCARAALTAIGADPV